MFTYLQQWLFNKNILFQNALTSLYGATWKKKNNLKYLPISFYFVLNKMSRVFQPSNVNHEIRRNCRVFRRLFQERSIRQIRLEIPRNYILQYIAKNWTYKISKSFSFPPFCSLFGIRLIRMHGFQHTRLPFNAIDYRFHFLFLCAIY